MRRWVLLVALVVGLTFALSSAFAIAARKGSNSVDPAELAKQAASSADINAQAEPQAALTGTHFADVAFDGSLTRGDSDVVNSQRLSTGAYVVTFDGNARNCGWVATPADTKAGDITAFSLLATVPAGVLGGNNNQVFVIASQPKGSGAINTGFSLLINC
jgi:hypothetical protein